MFNCLENNVYFISNNKVREKSILQLTIKELIGVDVKGKYFSKKENAEKILFNSR